MEVVENYSLKKYDTTDELGQDVMHVSGVANIEVTNPRDDDTWHEWEIAIPLDEEAWAEYSDVLVPHVALGSISNNKHAVNTGWSVNTARAYEINDVPHIRCKLALRDKDAKMHRVNFTAIVVGVRKENSMVNRLQAVPGPILEKALQLSKEAKKY